MAGNDSIQILRGSNVKSNSTIAQKVLLDGQPLYDKVTHKFFIGIGDTIINTPCIKVDNADNATHANNASRANSVECALNFFSSYACASNASAVTSIGYIYNGSIRDDIDNVVIYAPFYYPDTDSIGSNFGCWGVRNNIVGWYYPSTMTVTDNDDGTVNIVYNSNIRLMPN